MKFSTAGPVQLEVHVLVTLERSRLQYSSYGTNPLMGDGRGDGRGEGRGRRPRGRRDPGVKELKRAARQRAAQPRWPAWP